MSTHNITSTDLETNPWRTPAVHNVHQSGVGGLYQVLHWAQLYDIPTHGERHDDHNGHNDDVIEKNSNGSVGSDSVHLIALLRDYGGALEQLESLRVEQEQLRDQCSTLELTHEAELKYRFQVMFQLCESLKDLIVNKSFVLDRLQRPLVDSDSLTVEHDFQGQFVELLHEAMGTMADLPRHIEAAEWGRSREGIDGRRLVRSLH